MDTAPRCAVVHIHDLCRSHWQETEKGGNSECKLSACMSVRSCLLNFGAPQLQDRGEVSPLFCHHCAAMSFTWRRGELLPFRNTNKNSRANLNSNLPLFNWQLKVLRIPRDKKQWALEVVQLKSSFRALQTPRPHTDAEREGAWQSVQKRTIDEEKLFLGLESRAEAGCL